MKVLDLTLSARAPSMPRQPEEKFESDVCALTLSARAPSMPRQPEEK
jgi:hypothetical protein